MSVMLATVNPEAASRIAPKPLPSLGDTVVFHLRPGMVRAGRISVPAWVLKIDPDNRRLTLLVVYDHQDMMTEDAVPERTGSDYGWEIKPGSDAQIAALQNETAELRSELVNLHRDIAERDLKLDAFKLELAQTLFGEHEMPEVSFEDRIRTITERLDATSRNKIPGKRGAL